MGVKRGVKRSYSNKEINNVQEITRYTSYYSSLEVSSVPCKVGGL